MTFIITDPCIATKDTACVDACPVDCIHPTREEAEFESSTILYIDPEECIDCGACVPACPVTAIYDSVESVPESQERFIEANAIWLEDKEAAEALVREHINNSPDLMNLAPENRQESH